MSESAFLVRLQVETRQTLLTLGWHAWLARHMFEDVKRPTVSSEALQDQTFRTGTRPTTGVIIRQKLHATGVESLIPQTKHAAVAWATFEFLVEAIHIHFNMLATSGAYSRPLATVLQATATCG